MEEKVNRFVCPNDRQLALRAKLKTGWSIKTGSMGYGVSTNRNHSHTGLDPEEQATILEVIQRAEQLELREQERVGKLVERLENMRKNVLGRTSTQCLLCGDKFGLLGAQSVQCVSCKKLVCQKCSIEAWIGMKKTCPSGMGSLKVKGEKPIDKSFYGKDQWLCKICAESIEIWKKSGAWFFKGLPKYILPNQEKKSIPKAASSAPCSTAENDSSSEDERHGFLSSRKRTSVTENVSSQTKNLPQTENPPPQYLRQNSNYDTAKYSNPGATDLNVYEQHESENFGSYVSIKKEELYEKKYEKYERYEREKMEGKIDKYEDDRCSSAIGYATSYPNSMYLGDILRRDSVASKSISDWSWSDEKTSPSGLSMGSTTTLGFKQEDVGNKFSPSTCTLSLTLSYDSIQDTIHCFIHRAKNLPPMDINGLADPFCKLNIIPEGKLSTKLRTKTVHKTRNPEFNESLTFYEITESDLLKKSLHVLVFDDDKYGKDYIGEAKITLAGLRVQKNIDMTIGLEKLVPDDFLLSPDTNLPSWYEDPWCRGQILISLSYNTKKRALLVTIIRCVNLLPMDNNGSSDPFVKMHLKPDPHHKKYKSSIKWKNLNPIYNEEFAFETRPNELATQSLYITVWDKDYGKSNDYLGGLILGGVGSKGRRLKHWLDMIHYPDHKHEYWHNLTEHILSD